MSSAQTEGGNTGRADDRVLLALRRFLKGTGDGSPLVTLEEWVTGIVSHAILGKYPLHIFSFLPQGPDPNAMTREERHENSLMIAEAFFEEKIAPPELKKIAKTVTSDRALKYYLYAALKNWVTDKIRVAARTDDALYVGMKIEKTLRTFPDIFAELTHADNWRESLWTLISGLAPRQSPAGAIDVFRRRSQGIEEIAPLRSTATRYRQRLIATPALSTLLRDIFSAVNEPMSVFELLSIAREKISIPASSQHPMSLDAALPDSDLPLIETVPDPSVPTESQLIERFDLPACAAGFLDSMDDMDLQILREFLEAAFSKSRPPAGKIGQTVIKKLRLSTSTYYFRKDRLTRRLADVLSDQDELLFYQEVRNQLESRMNVTFNSSVPATRVPGQYAKMEKT